MPVLKSVLRPFAMVLVLLAPDVGADALERDCRVLIDAIERANAGEVVELELNPDSIYLLNRAQLDGRGLPLLRGILHVNGHGASIHGYPGIRAPLFHVAPGAELQLRDVVLSEAAAGALLNHGRTTLVGLIMEDNAVVRASALVVNHGSLRIESSDIRHNLVHAGRREAGTLLNYGEMSIVDSVFHDNAMDRIESTVVVAGSVLNRGSLHIESIAVLGNRPNDDPDRRGFGEVVDLGSGTTRGEYGAELVRSGSQMATAAPGTEEAMQVRSGL